MAEPSTAAQIGSQVVKYLATDKQGSGLFAPITKFFTSDYGVTEKMAEQPQETTSGGNIFDERIKYFGEILPGMLRDLPVFNQPAQQINIEVPKETKESGQMENGPQVYQGFTGALTSIGSQALRQVGRNLFGGGVGGAVSTGVGVATGYGVGQMMAGDACGCGPKPFVRLDKCGRPIITRAMQSQAKEMVMCMGIDGAAAALGIDVNLLAQIAFKKFKPRARGISGAQLKTAQRVNNKVMHMAKKLEASCKRPAMRRR